MRPKETNKALVQGISVMKKIEHQGGGQFFIYRRSDLYCDQSKKPSLLNLSLNEIL